MIKALGISRFAWIITTSLLVVITVSSVIVFLSVRNAERMGDLWQKFEKTSAEKTLILSEIRGLFGFDGVNYHLSRFVLRNDRRSIYITHKKILELSIALTAYETLGLDELEKDAFAVLQATTAQYYKVAVEAESLADRGASPAEIDQAIQFDDASAISSFVLLDQRLLERFRSNSENVRQSVENLTTLTHVSGVVLVCMLLLLTALILWYVRWRLLMPFGKFIRTFENINLEEDQLARLPIDKKIQGTELGAFAEAFNKMVGILFARTRELSFQKYALDEHSIVSMTDIKGNIVYVNEKFCAISGFKQQELIGQNHRILKSDEHSKAFYSVIWSTIANGKTWRGDIKNKNKNGSYYWVRSTIVPMLDEAGKPFRYVSIRTDITNEKLKEVELIKSSEEANLATHAKSNFLSTMSHEIRTPLNGVLGLAQLLIDTDLDKDQRQKVDTIISSGQTLLAIINDVLDMSKIEAGGLELETTPFSLKELLSMITTPFQSLADDKGIELVVSNEISSNLIVKGDPVRLRQILWNLLSNAIKFTEQGHVRLVISEMENAQTKIEHTKDHVLRFSISDTGAGIASDRIKAIFDAFAQEDDSITRKHGGTGLGLSIVQQLVDLMGGKIELESEVGTGSTFNVCIPFDRASADQVEQLSMRKPDSMVEVKASPLNILIAEDNSVNAMIAKSFLEKFGHHVRHVENGKLAVKAAKDGWADFILMDIHMPEMNGIDATKSIRATDLGKSLPIVGLTAEAFAERHALFLKAGMNGVLTKPFTERQLADTLAKYRKGDQRQKGRVEGPEDTSYGFKENGGNEMDDKNDMAATDSVPSTAPAGDIEKLDELRDQLNPEIVSNLLKQAQVSLTERVVQLRQAVEGKDGDQIKEVAHAIKGVSSSLFAGDLSEVAESIEKNAHDLEAVKAKMEAFEACATAAADWWRDQEGAGAS